MLTKKKKEGKVHFQNHLKWKVHSSPMENSHHVRLECSFRLLGFLPTWIIILISRILFCSCVHQHGSHHWDVSMCSANSTSKNMLYYMRTAFSNNTENVFNSYTHKPDSTSLELPNLRLSPRPPPSHHKYTHFLFLPPQR